MLKENLLAPLHAFRFHVDFQEEAGTDVSICSGAFSECTGLEATMEAKVIKEGGRNYGAVQRVGPVTFATVVLKRGITETRHLWTWFEFVTGGNYAYRLSAIITMFDISGKAVLAWKLEDAMPVKFKTADLNARATEVGVEELHIVHEGLLKVEPTRTDLALIE